MSEPDDMTPEQWSSAMAGDQGGAAQFATMRAFVPQYVDAMLARLKPLGGGRVAVEDGINSTTIQEVGS